MPSINICPPPRVGRFLVRGVNDDRDFCQCCGRNGLKRVVWIEDVDGSEVRHFGTTCALSPVKGFPAVDVKKAIKAHDVAIKEAARKAAWDAALSESKAKHQRLAALYVQRGGAYRDSVFKLTGRKVTVPADSVLYNACHAEIFLNPKIRT